MIKKAPKKGRKVKVHDFKTLKKGDRVQVLSASGPYYTDEHGNRHSMVDRGVYTVVRTDKTGVVAFGKDGYCHLYMGPKKPGLVPSITKEACKMLVFVGKNDEKL